MVIELLQSRHRYVDVVLLEAEQARGVVHEHVGVEHEQLDCDSGMGGEGSGGLALAHLQKRDE